MAQTVEKIEVNDVQADKAQRVFDGFDNFVARVGLNNNNVISAGMYIFNMMTKNRIQLEAAYRGSWIVGQMVDAIPEDMTRAGVDITTNEQDADIADFKSAISKRGIWTSLCSALKWSRLYGGSIAVIQIRGQDLSTPLNLDTIAKGQFTGLTVFDRWQLDPSLNIVIKEGPDIGMPAFYDIVTTATSADNAGSPPEGRIRVHHSRCVRLIGIELPFFQAITEMMWGESELERLWDRLIAFDQATMSAANLIERANNRTVGIDGLREIVAAGGKAQQGLEAQFEMMRQFQTNEGLTLIDKEDTFVSTSYSFSGLGDLLVQFGQQLAGASQIPLVRLFGQSPAGMNATGESDMRMYYDGINAKQEAKLRNPLDTVLRVLWRSTFGRPEPKDFQFSFVPLWQMTMKEKADLAKVNTESILATEEAGLIKRSTAQKELRGMAGNTGLFSNISDEEIKETEEQEKDAPPVPLAGEAPEPGANEEDPGEKGEGPVKNLDHQPNALQRMWAQLKGKKHGTARAS